MCHVVIEVSERGRVPAAHNHSLCCRALQSCPDPLTSANVGYHPPLAPPQLPALAGLPPLAPEPEELFRGCFIVIPAGPISNTYPLETKCLRLSSSSRVVRSPKLARPRRVLNSAFSFATSARNRPLATSHRQTHNATTPPMVEYSASINREPPSNGSKGSWNLAQCRSM